MTLASLFISQNVVLGQTPPQDFQSDIVDSLYSNVLEESRDFWVKLPENYNSKSGAKYPVIYLLDGFSLQSTLEVVYDNYMGHYLPPMILVGIANRNHRTRDLTTSQTKMWQGDEMNPETGGADKFTEFIEKELIPYIDKTFPTTNYRTLIGHSYAGLFTINMLVNHRELFQNYIAIDPSLDWDDMKLLKQAKKSLASESYKGKSLFVSLAAEQLHMMDETVTFENLMENTSEFTLFPRSIVEFSKFAESHKESGLNFSWKVYPEDLHGTVPMPSMMDGLVFLFDWFQYKTPPKYNNPETSVKELKSLLKTQGEINSQNLGYPSPPLVEEMLIGYGFMFMDTEQPKKAVLFFEKAIEFYPKSTMGYEMLADYYEGEGKTKEALKYLEQANEISGDDSYSERIEALKAKK